MKINKTFHQWMMVFMISKFSPIGPSNLFRLLAIKWISWSERKSSIRMYPIEEKSSFCFDKFSLSENGFQVFTSSIESCLKRPMVPTNQYIRDSFALSTLFNKRTWKIKNSVSQAVSSCDQFGCQLTSNSIAGFSRSAETSTDLKWYIRSGIPTLHKGYNQFQTIILELWKYDKKG